MNTPAMEATAIELVAPGKGILAADESGPTIEKRFKSVAVRSTEETRRTYREMLLGTPGLGAFISGVILYDETLRQKTSDDRTFVELLRQEGIIPGIKVDKGAKPLAGFSGEKVTEGWTDCATGSPNTRASVRGSRSGARCWPSDRRFLRGRASRPMSRRWRASRR
jgi:fructose-bisphosphate aldolase class I